MKVLYVSKALVVGAYRGKLTALARHVDVRGVIPDRWGNGRYEPLRAGDPPLVPWPVVLPGHNHLHLYRRPGRLLAPAGGARDGRPDLVHVDEEPYSAVSFQLLRIAARRGIPFVFFAWQNLEKRLPPPFGTLRTRVLRGASGGIAGTEGAGEVLRAQGFRGRLAVIPQFGVDPERFAPDPLARSRVRARLGAGPDELVVGFGGRLAEEKGTGVLLEAVVGLARSRLVLVGDGPERARLEVRARRAGAADRVHFAGHRPSTEMPRWLAGCDVVVLPSVGRRGWVEQFGRILVEAMACGVPVVGARTGEIPRVIGEAGIVVPPGDGAALSRALDVLARSPDRRDSLGERGRARVLERYTHDRIAARTAAFYREVVG